MVPLQTTVILRDPRPVTAHPFGEAEDFHNLSLLIFLCNVSGLLPLVPLSRYPAGAGRVWLWMSHDSYHNVHPFSRFSGAKQNGQRMKRNVTVMTMVKAGHDPAKCFESWRVNCVLDWLCFGHVSRFNTCVPLLDLAKIVSCINSCHVCLKKGTRNSSVCHHVPY